MPKRTKRKKVHNRKTVKRRSMNRKTMNRKTMKRRSMKRRSMKRRYMKRRSLNRKTKKNNSLIIANRYKVIKRLNKSKYSGGDWITRIKQCIGMNCGMPDGYNKVSELGKGGMGEVFLVEDRNEGNIRRALKIDDFIYIKNEYDCIKNMEKEQSSHGNYRDIKILRAYNYGYVNESVEDIDEQNMDKRPGYIVMDYINGGNLSEISIDIDDREINQFMQTIFYQIARVVDMMHSMEPPLYHCDIKLTNIMVDDQDNAYLIDFGLSTTDKEQSTKSSRGTKYYTPIQYIIYENSKVTDELFRYKYTGPLYDHDIYSIMVSIVDMLDVFRYYQSSYRDNFINIDTCILNNYGEIEKISNDSFFNADELIYRINYRDGPDNPIDGRFPLLKDLLFSIMYAMPDCGAIATDLGDCKNRDIPRDIRLINDIKQLLENPWIQAGNRR